MHPMSSKVKNIRQSKRDPTAERYQFKFLKDRNLKAGIQAQGIATRRANGIAGEEASKVDNVEAIVQVGDVSLKAHFEFFSFPDVGTDGSVDGKQRLDAANIKVDAVDYFLTILIDGVLLVSRKFKGQAGAVFRAKSDGNTIGQFITESRADGMTLVLRNPESPGEIS